jgi:galactokinase
MTSNDELKIAFENIYLAKPIITSAPGRINIIGEHTDYNDGFVLPAAIDRAARFALQLNGSTNCNITALDLDESASFSLAEPLKPSEIGWLNYILGVTDGFLEKGVKVKGFDVVFTSDVPVGSGMSSSAAIECGLGTGLNELFAGGLSQEDIALIGQRAEHVFVGVKCGIMDQFASVFGRENQVVKIDCRSQEREYFPADFGDYQVVLFDSKVKHQLVDSEYNIRREQCEIGVRHLQKRNPQIRALRDATLDDLRAIQNELEAKVFDRCSYVIEENNRVQEACLQLTENNIDQLGLLMNASHEGLSKLYEVSCPELDLLAALAAKEEAVMGSRMMGGGFGGCTINLIKRDKVDQVAERILVAYKGSTGIDAAVYKLNIADGAKVV